MQLRIDQEFEQLIQPLTAEERQQLEANLLADGCRDPLSVWVTADGPPILLDGHNRYGICTAHNLPFDVVAIGLETREDAINWIIDNQLGRRNLDPDARRYLRGKRYNREKRQGERTDLMGDGTSGQNAQKSDTTATVIGQRYGVDEKTIRRDGEFAEAVDAFKQIREDLPRSIITQRSRLQTSGKKGAGPRVTKARVINVGKLIKDQRVAPPPFMRHGHWQDFHILEALTLLAEIPLEEHPHITALFTTPPMPPAVGVQTLKNLLARGTDGRQVIYGLFTSDDPRERSLAQTLAAERAPEPDPQSLLGERLLTIMERERNDLQGWLHDYPHEPWSEQLHGWLVDAKARCAELRALKARIHTAHQERIAPYVQTPFTTGRTPAVS